jgi:hypothetical protein
LTSPRATLTLAQLEMIRTAGGAASLVMAIAVLHKGLNPPGPSRPCAEQGMLLTLFHRSKEAP